MSRPPSHALSGWGELRAQRSVGRGAGARCAGGGGGGGASPPSPPPAPAGPCAPAALTRQFASYGAAPERSPRAPAQPGDVPSGICPRRRGRAPSGRVPKGAWGRRDNCRGSLGAREASGWLGSRGEGAGGGERREVWRTGHRITGSRKAQGSALEPSMIP